MIFKVASLQMAHSDAQSKADRIAHAEEMIDKVANVDLILLSETWNVGWFSFDEYNALSEPIDGETISRIAAKAKEVNSYILAGSIIEKDKDGHLYNTSVLLDPNGKRIATYRKMHLVGFTVSGTIMGEGGEKAILKPGKEIVVAKTDLGVLGLSICYDIRFPELFRKMAVHHGVEVFLHPSGWPITKVDNYQALIKARANENMCWMVTCVGAGVNRGNLYQGYSAVVDPDGNVLSCGPRAAEAIVLGEVDTSRVYQLRKAITVFDDMVLPV